MRIAIDLGDVFKGHFGQSAEQRFESKQTAPQRLGAQQWLTKEAPAYSFSKGLQTDGPLSAFTQRSEGMLQERCRTVS